MGRFRSVLSDPVTLLTPSKSPVLPENPNDNKAVTPFTPVTPEINNPGMKSGEGGRSGGNSPDRKTSRDLYFSSVTGVTGVTTLKTKEDPGYTGTSHVCNQCNQDPDRKEIERALLSGDADAIDRIVSQHPDIGERAGIMEYDGRLDRAAANVAALHEYIAEIRDAVADTMERNPR